MNIQFLSVEESVWKLCQSNSLFQVALCQYFNIAINGMKFFLFYCQRWKWSCHSFRWCLCSCGFSPLQENACGTEGIEWGIGKMGLLFQIILTSYLLSVRGILRNTGPRLWSPLGISNYNFSWSGYGFLLEPYNSVLWIGKLIFLWIGCTINNGYLLGF